MLADIVLFPLYTLTLLCIGFGFFRPVARISGIAAPARELPLDLAIVLLMGQFCIGFVALLANFFVGVAHPVVFAAISVFCVLGMPRVAQCHRQGLLLLLGISVLLAPLAAFMPAGYDAGLYHLPHQLWIREEKIVFGLANFHGRFGFGSLQEYISAPQWIGEHFKLLAYSQVAYLVAFLIFLWQWSSSRNHHCVALTLFTVATFLLFFVLGIKGVFVWSNGYIDTQAGFLFAMAFLYGTRLLHESSEKKAVLVSDLFIFSFLSLFAVLMKLSSILIFAWAAVVYFALVLTRTVSLSRAVMLNLFPLTVLIAFLVKNVIASGCLLYPAAKSCFGVAWSARANAQNDAAWVTAWARHPRSGLYSLHDSSWLSNYWLPEYGVFCIKVVAIMVLLVTCSLVVKKLRMVSFDFSWTRIIGLSFLFFGLLFWFFKAPTPRFGLGIFLTLPPFLAFVFWGEATLSERLARGLGVMTKAVLVALGILLGGWNANIVSADKLMGFDPLQVGTPTVVQDASYGVRPERSDQCWIIPACSPDPRSVPEMRQGYLFFPPVQNQE